MIQAPPKTLQQIEGENDLFSLPIWGLTSEDTADFEEPPTVLIIETVDINRRLLRGILRPEGYRLLEASHPAEALELLEREKVDLVVLD